MGTRIQALAGPVEDTALIKACETGNTENGAKALKQGANPNAFGGWHEAPALHAALSRGNSEMVELLLQAGADSSLKDGNGATALHAAASAWYGGSADHEEKVVVNFNRMLAKGLSLQTKDHQGRDALEVAAGYGPAVVKILLEKGAVVSAGALANAFRDANRRTVDLLMAAGADPRALAPEGNSMLHALAMASYGSGDEDQVLGLLELLSTKGVALEGRNDAGRTPLLEAAGNHQFTVLKWLLDHGADRKAVDPDGNNALMLVCGPEGAYQGVIDEMLQILIQAGCPLDGVNREGKGALDKAEKAGNWESVAVLMRSGILPREPRGMLSQALLAWRNRPAAPAAGRHIVRLLFPMVADLKTVTVDGRPLAQELVFLGDPFLLDLALKNGAAVNAADAAGRTALMWAAAFLAEELKEMLLQAGADPGLRDQSGKSAADWAGLAAGPWGNTKENATEQAGVVEEREVFAAIASGNTALLKTLLAEKPEQAMELKFGLTPLQWAALHGEVAAAAVLLESGAARIEAGPEGLSQWSLAVLAQQADWCRWFLRETVEEERAALVDAAGKPREEEMTLAMAGVLLDFGWKPGQPRADKILNGNQDGPDSGKVRQRLEERARDPAKPTDPSPTKPWDPFAPENDSGRPAAGTTGTDEAMENLLWNAVIGQETGVLRFCFAQGLRVKPGSGLLLRAATTGNIEVARLLLDHGADVHEADTEGNLAVHVAAREGRREMVEFLIRGGASLTTKNKEGRSALEEAMEAGYVEWAEAWERKTGSK